MPANIQIFHIPHTEPGLAVCVCGMTGDSGEHHDITMPILDIFNSAWAHLRTKLLYQCSFSISCEDLQYFWEPLRNSSAQPILRMRSPTPIQASPAPCKLLISYVRAKVAAGGELGAQGATEDRSNGW